MYQGMKVKATKDIKVALDPIGRTWVRKGDIGTVTKAFKGAAGWNISVKFNCFSAPISTREGETEQVYP